MSNPFPGMNPYSENPVLWREIHSLLVVAIFNALLHGLFCSTDVSRWNLP